MKIRLLLLCLAMLPMLANAEIYKWKDKDGSVRYSDVPPASNVKQEPMQGKRTPKPTGQAPLTAVEGDVTTAINRDKAATAKEKADKTPLTKEEAAAKRAKDAEEQKKADEAKEAELKLKQENCKVSKSNLATYVNGGRIAKTNEKGERTYLGDDEINQGKLDAQKDVEKYCD
ncbi:MAG: hypothetical protein A3I83_06460 [Methylotenera sp. RIFCSPLOWO2_02_FULL_45_14]|nr:MAG: hypothetical protein A3I83_06460 [Methylotenera sp. RIFCSPLOWO2_02_FULL_45_14]